VKTTTSVSCPRCLTAQNAGLDPLFSECSTCGHHWSHPAARPPEPPAEPEPAVEATQPPPLRVYGASTHVCTRCHTAGWPRDLYRGSITAVGLVLLGLFALVAGTMFRPPSALVGMALLCTGVLVSTLEASRRSGPLCRSCETGPLVPLGTPSAQAIQTQKAAQTAAETGTKTGT